MHGEAIDATAVAATAVAFLGVFSADHLYGHMVHQSGSRASYHSYGPGLIWHKQRNQPLRTDFFFIIGLHLKKLYKYKS